MINSKFFLWLFDYRVKLKKGWFRKWNFDEKYYFLNLFELNSEEKSDFIEFLKLEVIDLMIQFTNYPDFEFFDEVLSDYKNLKFYIFTQKRVDKKFNKTYKSYVFSFGEIKNNHRIDLVFEEDIKSKNLINNIRLYISDHELYKSNLHFDLLYWNSSDKRSLEFFNSAFLDAKAFLSKNNKNNKSFFKLL
jgi:hypothetical protein